jgi:hypothetical protein
MGRRGLIMLALCVAMTVAAAPVAAAPARSGSARVIPDVTTLFTRAVAIVRGTQRPTYRRAVVLEADGMTRGGVCSPAGCSGGRGVTSAAGVVGWRFVFDNQASRRRILSATLFYGPSPKRFGRVTGYRQPFLDDVPIGAAPHMTLPRALSIVRRVGHRGKFFNVTLRSPLGPKRLHPFYIFGFAGGFIGVDTVTGKVRSFGVGVAKPGHVKT